MPDQAPDALHEQAREWGRRLLAAPPWAGVSDRVTLLVVDPPTGVEASCGVIALWLTLDGEAARSLPPEYRTPLTTGRAVVEQPRVAADEPPVTLAVLTDDAMQRLLQGTNRTGLEMRWQARHHQVVSDRLRRGEQYALRANLLPDDAPERIVRLLWLEVNQAARGLDGLQVDAGAGLAAAGEVSAALCRLACFDAVGAYPPVAYLRAAAAETRLGRRLAPWLDDLVRAAGGDDASVPRILGSRGQVLEEARAILGERYRDRPWLRDPAAFVFQPPR